ncbi:MAG: transglutaminase-like domain-containing protein [Phreatobacter sp.]|uniref:transglutaminase-like domain-containing protein n=1 Tax=Phreatobacter sp. TaxID=1966341 RepID=UPI002732C092|nr:transglutaminase-like domain-containing protein [Phreatobacter sp.]MDP2803030.1 transglutaminase-like domain-containing protein [Phreatobacter sp.]
MAVIRLTLGQPVDEGAEIVLAIPIGTPEQVLRDIDITGFDVQHARALNSGQEVVRLRPRAGEPGEVRLVFEEPGTAFPDWTFAPNGGPHETPSAELTTLIEDVAPSTLPPPERVEHIIRHIEERFTYGVRDIGLADDLEAMPPLTCGVHLGTCIDTHSYGVAAFRAAGISAAYVSGLFFEEGARISMPGHCWMAVQADGAPHHWDVSHFLKYGLGPTRPVLNPKPGVRYAMAIGRNIVVEGEEGPVTFGRLSGFNVLSGPGRGDHLQTRAEILSF